MKNLWPVLRGILIALVSMGLLFGGLSLSLAEGNVKVELTAPPSASITPTSEKIFTLTIKPETAISDKTRTIASNTYSPTSMPATATSTLAQPPTPTSCPIPAGWVAYVVQSGDTLAKLSTRYKTSITSLQQGNCLPSLELTPGATIYVPPLPTQTRIPCGPPRGWITIIVQPGDNLYRLSQAYGITVAELQRANCMGNSTLLQVGKAIYVPPWEPFTPTPFYPGIDTATYVPQDTPFDFTATENPTDTEVPSLAPTETPQP
jgi:LysM repeat protein